MPGLILGVLGTLLGRILRRFTTILYVVLRPDSGPSFAQSLDQRVIRHRCPPSVARPISWWVGGRAERSKFAVPHRGAGVVLNDCFMSAGPGRASLPYLPGGLRKTADPFPWRWT